MELFTISCTTCRARLRVRDESLIGEIIACLKCGSMVQVVAPAASDGRPGPVAAVAGARAMAPTDNSSSSSASASHAPLQATTPVVPPPLPKRQQHALDGMPLATNDLPRRAGLLKQFRTQWTLLGGGAAAGVVLGAAVWTAIWALSDAPAAISLADASAPTVERTQDASQFKRKPEMFRGAARQKFAARPSAVDSSPQSQGTARSQEVFKPTDGDQQHQSSGPEGHQAQPNTQPAPPDRPQPLPNETISSGANIPLLPADASIVDAAPADFPLSPHDAGASAAKGDGARAGQTRTTSQIDEQLADPLQRISLRDMELAKFAEFVSQWCAVPVLLDQPALQEAGVSSATRLSVELEATTLAEVLTAALAPHKLVFEVREGQIVITPRRRGAQ